MGKFQLKRYNLVINSEESKKKAFGSLGTDQLLIALTEYELGQGTQKVRAIPNQNNIY